MTLALVFAGQGGQHPDMLRWLAPSPLLDDMAARLGVADWRGALGDPAWAGANAHAQPVLTAVAMAAWQQLAPVLPPPAAVAGYSVGELAAFSVAGVFDAASAVDLAFERAAAMDAAGRKTPGGLMGVTGMLLPQLEAVCAQVGAVVAIRNGIDSAVVGGPAASLASVAQAVEHQGARCTRLPVAVASHTESLRPASEAFDRCLQSRVMARPRMPLIANASGGAVFDADTASAALSTQISQVLRWDECMEQLRERQVRCVLEIGPGQALARMWNQRYEDVPARSVDEFKRIEAIAAWVRRYDGS